MKFEINTDTKKVKLLEGCKFSDLEDIKKFIGDGWKDWEIEVVKETHTVIQRDWVPTYPYPKPYHEPWIWGLRTTSGGASSSTFMIDTSKVKKPFYQTVDLAQMPSGMIEQ